MISAQWEGNHFSWWNWTQSTSHLPNLFSPSGSTLVICWPWVPGASLFSHLFLCKVHTGNSIFLHSCVLALIRTLHSLAPASCPLHPFSEPGLQPHWCTHAPLAPELSCDVIPLWFNALSSYCLPFPHTKHQPSQPVTMTPNSSHLSTWRKAIAPSELGPQVQSVAYVKHFVAWNCHRLPWEQQTVGSWQSENVMEEHSGAGLESRLQARSAGAQILFCSFLADKLGLLG